MSEIQLRKLEEEDWQAFSVIRLQALKECPGVYASNYGAEINQTEKEWRDWLSQKGKCMFGLYYGAELIGIAGVFTWRKDLSGSTGILAADYIKPNYRGRGFARTLYEARIKWAQDYLSWKKAVISHRDDNEASRRANQQVGFQYTHTKKDVLWPDGVRADELWYEVDLNQLRQKV